MTIGKKIVGGLAVMLVLLIVIGMIAYHGTVRLLATRDWVTHTYEVLNRLEELESTLKDADTGARGYLLTEEDRYLDPFKPAASTSSRLLGELSGIIRDPVQQQRLKELEPIVEKKLQDLNLLVATMRKDKFDAARKLVTGGEGKTLMDDIRKRIEAMQAEERRLLVVRTVEADDAARLTRISTLLATGVGILFVVAGGTFLVRSITHPIRQGVSQLTSTSAEILASINQQAAGAQEQAAAVAETVTTVNEVTQTSEQAAQRARSVGDMVQKTLEVGKSGRKVVEESQAAMTTVKGQVEQTARNILSLAEQAQSIGNIIAVVGDIAEQTNLLALNAAIEASRAGEQGKGFAVVATEVRALADQSRKATGQVRQILGEIQKATNTAVLSTEVVTRGVASAIEVADQAVGTIKTLAEGLTEASRASAQIAAAVGQQANGMTQIHHAMRNLDEVAKQNAVAARQSAQAADDLNKLGAQLSAMISK